MGAGGKLKEQNLKAVELELNRESEKGLCIKNFCRSQKFVDSITMYNLSNDVFLVESGTLNAQSSVNAFDCTSSAHLG